MLQPLTSRNFEAPLKRTPLNMARRKIIDVPHDVEESAASAEGALGEMYKNMQREREIMYKNVAFEVENSEEFTAAEDREFFGAEREELSGELQKDLAEVLQALDSDNEEAEIDAGEDDAETSGYYMDDEAAFEADIDALLQDKRLEISQAKQRRKVEPRARPSITNKMPQSYLDERDEDVWQHVRSYVKAHDEEGGSDISSEDGSGLGNSKGQRPRTARGARTAKTEMTSASTLARSTLEMNMDERFEHMLLEQYESDMEGEMPSESALAARMEGRKVELLSEAELKKIQRAVAPTVAYDGPKSGLNLDDPEEAALAQRLRELALSHAMSSSETAAAMASSAKAKPKRAIATEVVEVQLDNGKWANNQDRWDCETKRESAQSRARARIFKPRIIR